MSMRWGRMVSLVAVAAWTATAWWQTHKSLPPGMHTASAEDKRLFIYNWSDFI